MLPVKQRYRVNLPEHLAKCETNYWQLRRLLPLIVSAEANKYWQFIIGNSPINESVISLQVLEQSKYTTLLHIVQCCPLQNKVHYVKSTNGAVDTHYRALARAKVTTVKHVIGSRCFTEDYSADVRLYHDAEIAEVIRYQQHRKFSPRYVYPNGKMHQVDEKSKINQFLGELLAHCLLNARVADVIIDGKNE